MFSEKKWKKNIRISWKIEKSFTSMDLLKFLEIEVDSRIFFVNFSASVLFAFFFSPGLK